MSLEQFLNAQVTFNTRIEIDARFAFDSEDCDTDISLTIPLSINSATPDIISGNGGNNLLQGNSGGPNQTIMVDLGSQVISIPELDTFLGIPVGVDCVNSVIDLGEFSFEVADLASDVLFGFGGNDTLEGFGGDDLLVGDSFDPSEGFGNDTINAGSGNDFVLGGGGSDTIDGGIGNDVLFSDYFFGGILQGAVNLNLGQLNGGPIELFDFGFIIGSGSAQAVNNNIQLGNFSLSFDSGFEGGDSVTGGAGDDFILGDAGNDTLDGGSDNDTILAGANNDLVEGDDGVDVLFGDTFLLETLTTTNFTQDISFNPNFDFLDELEMDDLLIIPEPVLAQVTVDLGPAGNDTISGGNAGDVISGDGGDDDLSGDSGTDLILGGSGNDNIEGGTETDIISGDGFFTGGLVLELEGLSLATGPDGNDTISGGLGDDFILGEGGDDDISGDEGVDVIIGGADDDTLDGGAANDFILGDNFGLQASLAVNSADLNFGLEIAGGAADDGNDSISGGSGDDVVIGDGGNDEIEGNIGNDVLIGDRVAGLSVGTLIDEMGADGGFTFDVEIGLEDPVAGPGLNDDTISGGEGTDVIFGDEGDDDLNGNQGTDVVLGGADDDSIDGEAGVDVLIGGSGDDTISGGDASDVIIGDTGGLNASLSLSSDDFSFDLDIADGAADDGNDSISGGEGDDVVIGDGGNDEIEGNAGNDVLIGDRLSGLLSGDLVDEMGTAGGFTFDLELSFEGAIAATANDTISGGSGSDVIFGDEGDDDISGGTDNDVIFGGSESDDIAGNDGDDFLAGDSFPIQDLLLLLGETFEVPLPLGNPANTFAPGPDGDDDIFGGNGNDILIGEGGNDLIDGFIEDAAGPEPDGDGQNDTVLYFNSPDSVVANIDETQGFFNVGGPILKTKPAISEDLIETDTEGVFDIGAGQAQDGFGTIDTLRNLENIIGSNFSDTLIGNDEDNVIEALDGNDLLIGGGGDDILLGNAIGILFDFTEEFTGLPIGGPDEDTDTVSYRRNPGSVDINLGLFGVGPLGEIFDGLAEFGIGPAELGFDPNDLGATALELEVTLGSTEETGFLPGGQTNTDFLFNIENAIGSDFADTIAGSPRDNNLIGGFGNDTISGGAGDDTLFGDGGTFDEFAGSGGGADSLSGDGGNDFLVGGQGPDTLDGGAGNDTASYATATSGVFIDLNETPGQQGVGSGDGGGDVLISIENLEGSEFDDILLGDENANILNGLGGNDIIEGRAGNDTICGGAGDDIIEGGEGLDFIDGGSGNDIIQGDAGNDTLLGNSGDDNIDGGNGNDFIAGGAGNDALSGDGGNDIIFGDDPLDFSVFGFEPVVHPDSEDGQDNNQQPSSFDDNINGGNGADTIVGGIGNDVINGNAGQDLIFGDEAAVTSETQVIEFFGFVIGEIQVFEFRAIETEADGNDVINGGANAETIYGGGGNDTISGNGGIDMLFGGSGNDLITGGNQGSFFDGESGDDTLIGSIGNDTVLGGDGDDLIQAGSSNFFGGDNLINSGSGFDLVDLGEGRDAVVLEVGDGYDTVRNFRSGFTTFGIFTGGGETLEDVLSFEDAIEGGISGVRIFQAIGEGADQIAFVEDTTAALLSNDLSGNFSSTFFQA